MKKSTTEKTTALNKKTAINKSKKKKTDNILVTWTATESVPRKYLWYIRFCAVAIWIILFLLLVKDWVLLVCAFTASLALVVTYLKTPEKSDYQLNRDTVTINKQTLMLSKYYAFTITTTHISKTAVKAVALLLPKKHLELAFQINLPDDSDKNKEVLNVLNQVLPFDEAKRFLLQYRILDYISSLLRLNF